MNAAVQTVTEGAQRLQAQGKAAAQKLAEKLPPEIRGIPCDCGVVNDPKAKFCSGCGKPVQAPGRCPSCGEWNTMTEDVVMVESKSTAAKRSASAATGRVQGQTSLKADRLADISTDEEKKPYCNRYP